MAAQPGLPNIPSRAASTKAYTINGEQRDLVIHALNLKENALERAQRNTAPNSRHREVYDAEIREVRALIAAFD